MGTHETSQALEEIKSSIARSPFLDTSVGFKGMVITGIPGLRETLEASLVEVATAAENTETIRTTANNSAEGVTTLTSANGSVPDIIRAAIGNIETMGDKAQQIGTGAEGITVNLNEALGHLAALELCLGRHNEMVDAAQSNLRDSYEAGVAATAQIGEYQSVIAGE